VLREVERSFGTIAAGAPAEVPPPTYGGGVLTKAQDGSSQSHLVLGFAVPPRRAASPVAQVAAAVLGEGMSSPLLHRVREERGLAYYTACSADVLDMCGQFVIEASTAPESLIALTGEVMALLRAHAQSLEPAELERAHHQLALRTLRQQERGLRWMEEAALEWFATGGVRGDPERLAALQAVSSDEVREFFARLVAEPPAVAVTGAVGRGLRDRVKRVLGN
jgi:predicted Zn-dependent peptidase